MEEIKSFVITLVSMIILITAIELISPDNGMKKYVKFVLGAILIAVMISPIISFISSGEDGLSKKIEEYIDVANNKSIETNSEYNENTTELAFKQSLEENCKRLLKEKFKDLDFESTIDCEIDMKNITYSINKVDIGVKNKEISTIKKIIINRNDESTEVSSQEDTVENKDEIIDYLSVTLNITKDNIKVYKIN
ncbi:stage III sporulation protein AF [Clostridium nigeriense]|uniref:stage III sporulation protein AF n=1 Tax=Clostridium nigeriense TaxID=1805470 RepID=UPI003D35163E